MIPSSFYERLYLEKISVFISGLIDKIALFLRKIHIFIFSFLLKEVVCNIISNNMCNAPTSGQFNNTLNVDLSTTDVPILDKKQGLFTINVYKENGPYRSFSVAKTGDTAVPIINTLLKKDIGKCSIELTWTDKIYLKLSTADNNGTYTVRWT